MASQTNLNVDESVQEAMWVDWTSQLDQVTAFEDKYQIPQGCRVSLPAAGQQYGAAGQYHNSGTQGARMCQFYRGWLFSQLSQQRAHNIINSYTPFTSFSLLVISIFTLCIYLYQFSLLNKILKQLQQLNYNRREDV